MKKTKAPETGAGAPQPASEGQPTRAATPPRARARGNQHTGPTVFTPEKVAAICARHASGTWLKHACAHEGVSYEGLKAARENHPEVALALAKAHAEGVEVYRQRKDSAMPGEDDWKKWAWDLERFDREAFAPPTTKVDAAVKVEPLSPETAALVLAVSEASKEGE